MANRVPVLRRGEFGYDVRLEGGTAWSRHGLATAGAWRRLGVFMLVTAMLAGPVAVCAGQPSVRTAIAGLLGLGRPGSGGSPARHITASQPPPPPFAGPPVTRPPTTAPAAGGVVSTRPAAAPEELAPASSTHLDGNVTAVGATIVTSCLEGATSPGRCAWIITVRPGSDLHLRLSWSGAAMLELKVDGQGGQTLSHGASAIPSLVADLPEPPASVRVAVRDLSGDSVDFQVTIWSGGS